MTAHPLAVRKVSGSGSGADSDCFHVVAEVRLEARSTAFAFEETRDLCESEVVRALEAQGYPPRAIAEELNAARKMYSAARKR